MGFGVLFCFLETLTHNRGKETNQNQKEEKKEKKNPPTSSNVMLDTPIPLLHGITCFCVLLHWRLARIGSK